MKTPRFTILVWLWLAVWAAAAPRVAVLDLSKSPNLEALLVTSLSRQKEIDLVERTEIARLVDEQRLLEFVNGGKFVGLGTLLKADGLLIVERTEEANGCSLRLISTRTGMSLLHRPCGGEDFEAEVRRTVPAIRRLADKLRIGKEQALPLAIMNIRGARPAPENAEIEKMLRGLLEIGLDEQPNVVLLERRRLAEVNFERALDASDTPPLVNAAFLIAGSFEAEDGAASKYKITLQIKRAGEEPGQTLEISADLRQRKALAQELKARVLAALGQKDANPKWAPADAEAREFFEEALWQWRHENFLLAEQALDAAIALGLRVHDTKVLEIWFRTWDLIAEGEYDRPFPKLNSVETWQEHAAIASRLVTTFRAFRAAGGESALTKLNPNLETEARDWELLQRVTHSLIGVLREAPEGAPKETWKALQQDARELCGFDPEGRRKPFNMGYVAEYTDVLAEDAEEEFRFFSFWLKSDHPQRLWLIHRVGPWKKIAPETIRRLGEELVQVPELSVVGHLFLCRVAPKEKAPEAYRELFRNIEAQLAALEKNGILEAFARTEIAHDSRFNAERLHFVRAYFRSSKSYQDRILFEMLSRLQLTEDEAQDLWEDFKAYRSRVLAATPAQERADLSSNLSRHAQRFLNQHPKVALPKVVAPETSPAIVVQRCWHPYGLPEFQKLLVNSNTIAFSENSVWFIAMEHRGGKAVRLVEIPLDTLVARTIAIDPQFHYAGVFTVTEDAIFLVGGNPNLLGRYDRKAGTWETRPVTAGREPTWLQGKLYFDLWAGTSGGILQYDWATGQSQLLASTERRPARNQFDTVKFGPPYLVRGFFDAPDGKVVAVVGFPLNSAAYVQEEAGDWRVFKDEVTGLLSFGDCRLLAGANGDLTCIDPRKPQPELWLSKPGQTKPGEAQALWDLPGEWTLGMQNEYQAAFRRDEFFILERHASTQFQLRWYWRGGSREGRVMPLKFEFPQAQRERLEEKNNLEKVKADEVLQPERGWGGARIFTTKAGLIILNWGHGLWFIPNEDLNAFRKQNEEAGKAPKK